MKKLIVALMLATLTTTSAFAAKPKAKAVMSDQKVKSLISALQKKVEARKKKFGKLDTKIVRFFMSPAQPKQGENVVVFAQVASRFQDSDVVLEATFDGNAVALEKSATELWAYDAGAFTKMANHSFTANVFIQDSAAAADIKAAIIAIDAVIADLNDQIDAETDETAKNILIAERDLKISQRADLIDALDALKKSIASETISFSIEENAALPGYPRITSVSPKFGSVNGGTTVTVQGQNFVEDMTGKIGGISVSINFHSATQVSFVTPDFLGAESFKDLELETPGPNSKNILRKNAFYALNGVIENVPPVAVSGATQEVTLGAEVAMDGSGSYDLNGHTFTPAWKVISAPAGSGLSVGAVYSTDMEFAYTPAKPGAYVWELVVTEVGTSPVLASEPSLTVVTVNPPANTAPAPTAPGITVGTINSGNSQIAHGDVDDYQAHAYVITKQSALGTATVSNAGLVSFTAGTTVGSGTIEVAVVDNGNPPLSGAVSIPVTVETSTVAIDNVYTQVLARDGFVTVAMGLDTLTTTAPSIKSVVWDFGDGTVGASSRPFTNDGYVEHDYLTAGTYTVTATMTDSYGTTGSKSYTFSTGTSAMPVPHLVSDVYSGAAPLTVSFDATASTDDVGINQYRFRWFDGSSDTTNTSGLASHTFNNDGNYRVRLRTRDADNNMVFTYVDIHVGSSPLPEKSKPMPMISVGAKEVAVGLAHSFSGANSYDPNPSGSITAYRWNFGDYVTCDNTNPNPGCVDTGSSVTYSYPFAYNFFANLEVEGALGGVTSTAKEVLAVLSGHAPRAVTAQGNLEVVAPFTLNVDGSHSFDYDGTISAYQWNFGDPGCTTGCTSSGATGSYTYSNEGQYWVSLVVTDDEGNMHDAGFNVFVVSSAKKKAHLDRMTWAVKAAKFEDKEMERERDKQKSLYSQLCSRGSGVSCFSAGKMYEEDGNSFALEKFSGKACALGYSAACSVKK